VTFPQALGVDYGVPLGRCEEKQKADEGSDGASRPGGNQTAIFTREWSKATVSLDCLS
jgi:hypothetical protein